VLVFGLLTFGIWIDFDRRLGFERGSRGVRFPDRDRMD
jgi:hypothetical protein